VVDASLDGFVQGWDFGLALGMCQKFPNFAKDLMWRLVSLRLGEKSLAGTCLGASLRAVFVSARKAPKYARPGCLHFVLLGAL